MENESSTDKHPPKPSFRDSLKSMDTEETLDIYFYRPIGFAWALLFMRLGITPNAVTIASFFIGAAGGILFYFPDLQLNIIGMLLLVWANSFDSADGQLARMTNNRSQLGRILDGMSGNIWFVCIYCAICLRLMTFNNWGFGIWFLGAAAGACHVLQASISDYYRNIHLLFLKGKGGSEVDNGKRLQEEYDQLSWKSDFTHKLTLRFYKDYTLRQERFTKDLQTFLAISIQKYGDNQPKWLCEQFREMHLPLMKYTNMLTFNTRILFLFFCIFIDQTWLYFVFELTVLNIMLMYMISQQEKISRHFTEVLRNN